MLYTDKLPFVEGVLNRNMLNAIRKLADGEHAFIVCIGDSITEQNYHLRGKLNYVGRLTERLMELYHRRSRVFNAGVSGDTTVGLLNRLERDALRFQPDLVTVMIGMNDSSGERTPLDAFGRNLERIVGDIRSSGSEALLLTQNPLDFHVREGAVTVRGRYPDYVSVIRNTAAATGTPLCDICAAWEAHVNGSTNNHLMLMDDSIHPGERGHELMASVLFDYVGISPDR